MVGNIKILPVVYMGGSCGDLVSAMIDLRDTTLDPAWRRMKMPMERQRLKKPHTFLNDLDKDVYLDEMAELYASVPSHDLDYHIARKHLFVSIRVRDPDIALWAARRFRDVHRTEVWQSVQQGYNITTVEQYAQLMIDYGNMIDQHTSELIELEDIISGSVIPKLEQIIGHKLDKDAINCYRNWQNMQNGNFFI